MKFDYTYITLFGYTVFEPMVLLTNSICLLLTILFTQQLFRYKLAYARHMGLFFLTLGISMIFGAIGHAVHLQAGEGFFKLILLLMNLFSAFSVFFCFRGSYILVNKNESKRLLIGVIVVLLGMLTVSLVRGDFTVIKVMAGAVLLYAVVVHHLDERRSGRSGNRLVKAGIGVSFLSIVSHTLHISFHEWFNHKDVAHVIMIAGVWIIYLGMRKNSQALAVSDRN